MITYQAPKKSRVKNTTYIKRNRFFGKENQKGKYRVFIQVEIRGLYWYFEHIDKWVYGESDEYKELRQGYGYSNTHSSKVNNVRAFRRYLKKHNYLPNGTKVTLVSRIIGNNIYGKIK